MGGEDCRKRDARQKINAARDFFNESSYSLMKYHLRYCSEKLLALERGLRGLQSRQKKFRFTSVLRPGKDFTPQALKDNHIGGLTRPGRA